MRISDWSSDVCSSDLLDRVERGRRFALAVAATAGGKGEEGERGEKNAGHAGFLVCRSELVEKGREGPRERRIDLGEARRLAERGEAGHRELRNAARPDAAELRQIGCAVHRTAVHRHPKPGRAS